MLDSGVTGDEYILGKTGEQRGEGSCVLWVIAHVKRAEDWRDKTLRLLS